MTLVELLVTIVIISILAAMILGVASVAGESAREAETRHIVLRLHTLLTTYYDTYKTRRVQLRPAVLQGIEFSRDANYDTPQEKGQARALARLYALRELILMEVPDRWSDILLTDVPANPASGVVAGGVTYALFPFFQDGYGRSGNGRTQLANVYLRRYAAIATRTNSITGNTNTREDIIANQGAECLYMIVTLATGDGEARTLFSEGNIGDTDGDGAPEFLDGWGHPISFIRWAPGFDSQIQINANQFLPLPVNDAWKKAAAADHDPFDVYRVDKAPDGTGTAAFRTVPLIFSAGRDEEYGIETIDNYVALKGLPQARLSEEPDPDGWPAILPWAPVNLSMSQKVFLGTDTGEGTSADNVHNHLVGQR